MALTEYSFGDLIELYITQNSDGKYGADKAVGINIDKEIRVMRGDSSRKELEKFYIVPPGAFVYNPRGSRKLGLGYNDTSITYITTFNNMIFKIKDCAKNIVLPRYLFMYLARKEWDRKAEFLSWGSSTEVFSWDIFCETSIMLPPLPVQQKYVDVYNSMLANQRNYEQGLEDLKLTVDAIIEQFKHKTQRVFLGDLVEESDIRNEDGSVTNVHGVNKDKLFMPSVASGADLTKYKIVRKGQFACNLMHVGRDVAVPIALQDADKPLIVSPAYLVFSIKSHDVLPEYILMWLSRAETDRYAWFMCDTNVRSGMEKKRFYEIDIPVPTLTEQESLIEIYVALSLRREINEQLKTQIRDICPILIKGSLEEAGT